MAWMLGLPHCKLAIWHHRSLGCSGRVALPLSTLASRRPQIANALQEVQSDLARHCPSGRCFAGHSLACAARQHAGQLGDPPPGRSGRARSQLQGRPPRLQSAHAALRHAGLAAVRGSDTGRLAHQPLLSVDAGLDHARLRAPWPGPAGLLPAVVERLARRLRGQHEGRRPDPARLRRLSRLPAQAGKTGAAGHAFCALGFGAAGTAWGVDRLRQLPGRSPGRRTSDRGGTSPHRLPRWCIQPLPRIPGTLPRLRCLAARSRCRDGPSIAGRRGKLGGSRPRRGGCTDGARPALRCRVRGQRPDRDRRDARLHRTRSPRTLGHRCGRLRRYPRGALRQPATDHRVPGHHARRRTAGGNADEAGTRRARGEHHAAGVAGGAPLERRTTRRIIRLDARSPSQWPARRRGRSA